MQRFSKDVINRAEYLVGKVYIFIKYLNGSYRNYANHEFLTLENE